MMSLFKRLFVVTSVLSAVAPFASTASAQSLDPRLEKIQGWWHVDRAHSDANCVDPDNRIDRKLKGRVLISKFDYAKTGGHWGIEVGCGNGGVNGGTAEESSICMSFYEINGKAEADGYDWGFGGNDKTWSTFDGTMLKYQEFGVAWAVIIPVSVDRSSYGLKILKDGSLETRGYRQRQESYGKIRCHLVR